MFDEMEISFSYFAGENKRAVVFKDSLVNRDFCAKISFESGDGFKKLKLSILPATELEIDSLSICSKHQFFESSRIFANGYQSWTDSREFFPDERMRGITRLAAPILEKYQLKKYGDYMFYKYSPKKGVFHGYTYSYVRDGDRLTLIGSLSESNGFTIIELLCKDGSIIISKECKGLSIKDEYIAFDIILAEGREDFVFDKWFEKMEIGRPSCSPMTGWTSWYNYYQNISEDIILENLNNIHQSARKIDMFQIDDGYQCAVGDWLKVDKIKFPNGMKYIADAVKLKGYKAGIWLAPFVCETNSELFKEKKEWLLRDKNGKPVLAGSNWSRFYALDINNTEVRDYIRNVFSVVLNQWGYDMVKLDFLYAVCLIPSKYKTRGQIMTEAMQFIRECTGDRLILGCGVPLGPCFGIVDYCRISCDVGLDWNDKFYMRYIVRERISTFNAIKNAISRRQLNGRAFLNDPDVFIIRDDNVKLTDAQKLTLFTANYIFGNLLFTSDNTGKYDSGKWALFNKINELKPKRINKVDCGRNGLVEVSYFDGEEKCLALINLGRKRIRYDASQSLIREISFGRKTDANAKAGKIKLDAYESRIFITG